MKENKPSKIYSLLILFLTACTNESILASISLIKKIFLRRTNFTHHIRSSAERFIKQAFNGQPLYRAILVVAEAMIILRKQVSG